MSDEDEPAPSPSAAVVARRASRIAKSLREESGCEEDTSKAGSEKTHPLVDTALLQREKRAEPAADDPLGSSRGAHNDPENNESMDNEKKPEPTHTHVTA